MNFPPPPQILPYNQSNNNNQQQSASSSLIQSIMSASQQAMQQQQEQQIMANLGTMLSGGGGPQRAPYGQQWAMPPQSSRKCYHCHAIVPPGENHTARNCPVKKKEDDEAAAAKAEKIVQEKMARGEIVMKQELEVPQGCMRSLGASYSAGNAPNFGASMTPFGASMTPGFSTPGSTAVMQPPPPPQQQPQATMQEQMQQMQHGLAAEMQTIKSSITEALKEEMAPLSSRVSSLLKDVEDGKASRVLMRGEVNKLTTKYDELAKSVASIKTLEASVTTCMQSVCKRMQALEAAPVQSRVRDNAGNASGTPATATKGKGAGGAASAPRRVSKKAAAAVRAAEKAAAEEAAAALEEDEDEDAEADSDDEPSPSLAERAAAIVAEGAEGALPQRTTPPRKAKRARTTIRIDS